MAAASHWLQVTRYFRGLVLRTQKLEQDEADQPEVVVAKSQEPRFMRHLYLVLCASEIRSTLRCDHGTWHLRVNASDLAQAQQEIDEYQLEISTTKSVTQTKIIARESCVLGVCVYALILGAVMYSQDSKRYGEFLTTAGQMQSIGLREGQWWRCVTALTLHQDAAHLAGNLAMGFVYGWMVSNRLGAGLGWLGITLAASLGNLLSGLIRPDGHISIGASTAVFAGLGILVAEATIATQPSEISKTRRWLPLISGCVLFAWTGTGGTRTDVLAHLAGFCMGTAIGVAICKLPNRGKRWIWAHQLACGLFVIGLVVASWMLAIT
ncbi:MAG: rhomboid family intramembrane serine protease [Rubripirellula sp.]|nr:rhomboid family intramembrane serine protease [Rubripirellula sp.]